MSSEPAWKNDLLDTKEKVYGLLYEITNTSTELRYVGQTVSHRKNKDKYRPFGIIGRLNDHISEATNNTKKKQCRYLNNAIRKYGKDVFTVSLLEICDVSKLNDREQYYIEQKNTLFPNGYNLTIGGKTMSVTATMDAPSLQVSKKRGGCVSRSKETREKMSARAKNLVDNKFCASKSRNTLAQHHSAKVDRFKDCIIELEKIDSYIRKKGNAIVVRIGEQSATFSSKYETIEQVRDRAKAFIELIHMQRYQTAGSP